MSILETLQMLLVKSVPLSRFACCRHPVLSWLGVEARAFLDKYTDSTKKHFWCSFLVFFGVFPRHPTQIFPRCSQFFIENKTIFFRKWKKLHIRKTLKILEKKFSCSRFGEETVVQKKCPSSGSNARPQFTQAGAVPDCATAYLP